VDFEAQKSDLTFRTTFSNCFKASAQQFSLKPQDSVLSTFSLQPLARTNALLGMFSDFITATSLPPSKDLGYSG
jgi:hypothetical protein